MIKQLVPHVARRRLAHAGVLAAGVLWFLLSASPPGHADEIVLPEITAPTVEAVPEPTVPPLVESTQEAVEDAVVEVLEPTVQQPVEQVVEPPLKQVEQPLKQVEESLSQVGPAAEQTAAPEVRSVEPVVEEAVKPAQQVEPVTDPAAAPSASQVPVAGGPDGGRHLDVSEHGGSAHATAGATGWSADQRRSQARARTHLGDLAPRATTGVRGLVHSDQDDLSARDANLWPKHLVATTNGLMRLYAGHDVPAGINAGLAGVLQGARAPWLTALQLGLLLGLLSLVMARRRAG